VVNDEKCELQIIDFFSLLLLIDSRVVIVWLVGGVLGIKIMLRYHEKSPLLMLPDDDKN
jgi:hypothetical protein